MKQNLNHQHEMQVYIINKMNGDHSKSLNVMRNIAKRAIKMSKNANNWDILLLGEVSKIRG